MLLSFDVFDTINTHINGKIFDAEPIVQCIQQNLVIKTGSFPIKVNWMTSQAN